MKKSNWAIIPARGGSKGIPGKNIIPVAGRPLIEYTIEAALRAETIDRLFVSTDDQEIARVAEGAGAEVVQRPAEISGDFDSSESALLHTLEVVNELENFLPDVLTFLQCTSPLTLPEDIDGTAELVLAGEADTAFAAVPFHYYLWKENESGEAQPINHEVFRRPMRQEREPQFLEAGAVYVMKTNQFMQERYRFFGKIRMYVMPESRCFEIDEPADIHIAEALFASINQDTTRKSHG